VLQLIASEYLYKYFPEHHEGHLSVSVSATEDYNVARLSTNNTHLHLNIYS